jgi:hypothetical protein
MRKYILVIGLLGLAVANANSASALAESCDQIRTQINAQTGILPKVNTELLRKLARPECRFSGAEVYRAAYGDKPMPINESVGHRAKRGQHHDDDD